MKKIKIYSISTALVAAFVFFTSCEDNTTPTESISDEILELAIDDAFADDVYEDVDGTVETEIASLDASGYEVSVTKSTELDACKIISVDHPDSTRFPKIITIDYGDGCTNIINGDTITKKGIIQIELTERFFIPGSERTITFIDFSVNDIQVEGTRTVTFNGLNVENNLEYEMNLVGGILTFPDGTTYTRESERTREWERAANPLDDVFYINGSVEGENRDGINYSREIVEELVIVRCPEFKYKWTIVDGKVLNIVGEEETTIDYGDGTCNDEATLWHNGETRMFKIRNRYQHRHQNRNNN